MHMSRKLALAASVATLCLAAGAASAGSYTVIAPYSGANTTTTVTAINNAGYMTGVIDFGGTAPAGGVDVTDAFIRDPSGNYLTIHAGWSTVGRAINNSNTITGYVTDSTANLHTDTEFSFTSPGFVFTVLKDASNNPLHGIAQGINSSGANVGDFYNLGRHGYVLNGASFTQVDIPGAVGTVARGLADNGAFDGWFFDASGNPTAYLTGAGGVGVTLIQDPNQVQGTYLEGLSPNGRWADGQWLDAAGNLHAFLLDTHFDVFTELTPPTGTAWETFGVNDLGQVVLTEADNLGSLNYLYSPFGVPEPATWAMLILGVGLTGAMVRRRGILAKA